VNSRPFGACSSVRATRSMFQIGERDEYQFTLLPWISFVLNQSNILPPLFCPTEHMWLQSKYSREVRSHIQSMFLIIWVA
jgi:hypothetical protein